MHYGKAGEPDGEDDLPGTRSCLHQESMRVTAGKELAGAKNQKKGGLVTGLPVLGETFPAVHRSPLGRGERNLALFSAV